MDRPFLFGLSAFGLLEPVLVVIPGLSVAKKPE